ncbi:class I SAM-dependent methyltransferase [Rhodococcus tibetensis]|uniref:Class I SAM-dependent methyltransferase n=1 Tax=Rhodococcus tibetensis TaxID=2965064 RepID=A0ABT1Q9J8_9NOCA|nr:class I SAM-dependent methyltransferase [Rhodococcus sp. FXJ9.536]MCQ4118927.1 class I SAM-dependent methyltransferase [Rhodococcus sp. FXJ9.536]
MSVQHRSLTTWALDTIGIDPESSVLDIGCGSGMALEMISRRTSGKLMGVDYSDVMVEQTLQRNRTEVTSQRLTAEIATADQLPCADESFDLALAIETVYFWPDIMAGLREMHRILRPGGRVGIVVEMSKESMHNPTLTQRAVGRRFIQRSESSGMTILSGQSLCTLLTEAGFISSQWTGRPERSLGWLCASATKP